MGLLCGGTVLEPETMSRPFGKTVWRAEDIPEDGCVIATATYDDLKRKYSG